ncbi:sugar phosphate isomerase/epimerase family protein [Marinitenerispora sediminis]|uniref:Epimerase n=1 Tax=Marinitenerispora sediminis TaxID=1931232 RepID=A0A368SYH3_9ACTN|nr:sugar phosphate isomerase/epimerase family protein [Marinitenerispora sediminis]RCV47878.1 epimerase [Marinitenerispora sediminis]RCV49106.1 epimerase [Marinitenerispora sediminis]RCV52136.1 epimerase [Marinitenerispora sediminis]
MNAATSNPLGVHALVWVGDWSPESARYAVEQTAAAGFDLIEIPLLDPSAVDPELTRKLLDRHGLAAGTSLGLSADTDVSSTDPDVVARGRRVLADALAVTRDIGSGYFGGVIFSALRKYGAPLEERGRANAVETIAWLAERAKASGITIGLEIVNRYETNVLNTTEQALAFRAEVGADNVVLHLDTYHMNIEEPDFAEPVRQAGGHLGYVHVGESHRGYLGQGTIDFPAFFAALTAAGYTGPITFESFSSAVVHPSLSNDLAVWRNLWSDGADLARHARRFITDGLTQARG